MRRKDRNTRSTSGAAKSVRRLSQAAELENLRSRLAEAEETLRAIREGEIDAVVVSGSKGEQIYSLVGAESVYRLIVEAMKEAALTVSFDGRILFCNTQFGDLVKQPIERIVGHPLREFIAPDDVAAAERLLVVGREQPVKQRLAFLAADGTAVPAHISAALLNQPDYLSLCVVATDLTELEHSTELIRQLRQHQEALRKSEERLRLATSATKDAIWDMDLAGGTIRWNDAYASAFGRPPETGDSWQWWIDHIHLEDRERAATGLQKAIDGRDGVWTCEYRFLRGDGTWAEIFDRAFIARNPSGKALRVVGAMMDLTDRKRVERQLFVANQRLQALMNALPVGVSFSDDPTCQNITGNPAVLAQFDASAEDNLSASAPVASALGRQVRFFREERQIADAELPLQRAVDENRAIPPTELEIVMPNGRRWYADVSAAPIHDIRGNVGGGVAVTVDITNRKKAEEALRQANINLEQKVQQRTAELAQRAAQLRALASEITLSEQRERRRMAKVLHDHIQQLLVGAKFRTAILYRGVDEQLRAAVTEIDNLLTESLNASRSLTAELSPPILHEGGLVPCLQWLARWMSDKHDLKVDLVTEEDVTDLPEDVKVLLFESVRELLFNTVKHARVYSARIQFRVTDDHLRVVVSDQGTGFNADQLKPAGTSGGGFGLFSIRERLELMGGRMEIDSSPGKGSRFVIMIPVGQAVPAAVPAEVVQVVNVPTEEMPPPAYRAKDPSSAAARPRGHAGRAGTTGEQ